MATKTKTTKLTAHEKSLLAAIFARSNMGMEKPPLKEVLSCRTRSERMNSEPHYADFVMRFCQSFMESDEHHDIFLGEAKMWWKEMSKREVCREYILKVWPDMHFLMWSEPYYLSSIQSFATEAGAKREQKRHQLSRRYKDRKGLWVVDCLMKEPVTPAQQPYEKGYPNFNAEWHKAGEVL